jgi:hypothetical protein
LDREHLLDQQHGGPLIVFDRDPPILQFLGFH